MLYRGRIDLLVWQDQFWVVIIEAKKVGFSLESALIAIKLLQTVSVVLPDLDQLEFVLRSSETPVIVLRSGL